MRYVRTERFKADYHKRSAIGKGHLRRAMRALNDGCERFMRIRDPASWPSSLRVKPVRGAHGVWETTWSFSGPDGRATWEWTSVVDDAGSHPVVRWRRIGDHSIFTDP